MKAISLFAICSAIFLVSASSMAAFNIEELQQAEGIAVADFAKENAAHLEHLTGWKTWKSDDGAKVKIYINHGGMNMEYNYACQKQADSSIACQVLE